MRARPALKRVLPAALGSVMLAACAALDPGPARKEIDMARVSIDRAMASYAIVHAPDALKPAEEKIARAYEAFRNGRFPRAERLAEQARIDAALAEAQARNADIDEKIIALRNSMDRLALEIERARNNDNRVNSD